jgi:hypothetical protein
MQPPPSVDDQEHLDAILMPFEAAADYVASHHEQLMSEHAGQWIAASADGVLAASPRRADISRELRRRNIERNHVYVTFLTTKKQTLIL